MIKHILQFAVLAVLALLDARNAWAGFTCPPVPARPAVDVPGKTGETGWLLEDDEADAKGNKVQIWCLQAVAGPKPPAHGGDDVGFLYKPAGAKDGDAVWIGACVFPGVGGYPAMNVPNKSFDKLPNGQPDKFTKLTWGNLEPYPLGSHDWEYSYDTATNMLTVNKTEGDWFDTITGNAIYGSTDPTTGKIVKPKIVGTDVYEAPKNFGDIKFKGDQVTDASGAPGAGSETFAAIGSVSGNNWSYILNVAPFSGSGTAADPYLGEPVDLIAGDTFSITGAGIQNPFVSSPASLPHNGGWVVQSFSSTYVTFVATADAEFLPGIPMAGFGFSSAAPAGKVAWALSSSNESIGSSGIVSGPITPPSQLHLFGPSPNQIPAGQHGIISATVESSFTPMPGMTLTFTRLAGNLSFNDGDVSPTGATAKLTTATNGAAVMDVTAGSAGVGLVRVNVAGTNLNAYALFFMH